jgi:hypothetical protein
MSLMLSEVYVVLNRPWVSPVLVLISSLWCPAAFSSPEPQLLNQSEIDIAPYRNARSFTDRPLVELAHAVPELKGIEAPASQQKSEDALRVILQRVGDDVKEFVAKLPDITSLEEITMERLRTNGSAEASYHQSFRYLVVPRRDHEKVALQEYRTDLEGQAAEPNGLAEGLMITKGFASASIHFYPSHRADSAFRYVGRQMLNGRETEVVAFAQRPGWAELVGRLEAVGKSAVILLQGLAWIDGATYQIIRMRTDLLAPRTDVGLKRETTEIVYTGVQFPDVPGTLWLPREVTVTSEWDSGIKASTSRRSPATLRPVVPAGGDWNGRTYRNVHRYSDYKLFGAMSKLKF